MYRDQSIVIEIVGRTLILI